MQVSKRRGDKERDINITILLSLKEKCKTNFF